jgi:hypothetical protein
MGLLAKSLKNSKTHTYATPTILYIYIYPIVEDYGTQSHVKLRNDMAYLFNKKLDHNYSSSFLPMVVGIMNIHFVIE